MHNRDASVTGKTCIDLEKDYVRKGRDRRPGGPRVHYGQPGGLTLPNFASTKEHFQGLRPEAAPHPRLFPPFMRKGFILLLIFLVFFPGFIARGAPPSEYEAKSAFLYNFFNFVEWGADPTSDLFLPVIGVIGNPEFKGVLEQSVKGRKARGKNVAVKLFSAPEEVKDCQILYIDPDGLSIPLEVLLSKIPQKNLLTVDGPHEEFLQEGGIISFYLDNNQIRFNISNKNALKAGIKISSKLLRLASKVIP